MTYDVAELACTRSLAFSGAFVIDRASASKLLCRSTDRLQRNIASGACVWRQLNGIPRGGKTFQRAASSNTRAAACNASRIHLSAINFTFTTYSLLTTARPAQAESCGPDRRCLIGDSQKAERFTSADTLNTMSWHFSQCISAL